MFTLEINGEEVKTDDNDDDLLSYVKGVKNSEWMIYDTDTGEILYDNEGEGSMQKFGRVTKSVDDNDFDPEEAEWADDDEDIDQFSEDDIKRFASRVEMNIGEYWDAPEPEDFNSEEEYTNQLIAVGEHAAAESFRVTAEKMFGITYESSNFTDLVDAYKEVTGHDYLEIGETMGRDMAKDTWKDSDDKDFLNGDDLFSSKEYNMKPLEESLSDYNNKIENAIADLMDMEEESSKKMVNSLSFDDYLDVAMAIDREDIESAKNTLLNYMPEKEMATVESVAQEIHYLNRQNCENVLTPALKALSEIDQRAVFSEMSPFEMQKILANLRGYSEPGIYENSLFQVQLVEEAIQKLKSAKINDYLKETGLAPGKQNQMQAYGAKEPTPSASTTTNSKKMASYTNDKGEQETGEVVSDSGNQVMVRTKNGTKRFSKDQVMIESHNDEIEENEIVRIKELAGIKESRETREAERLVDAFKNGDISEIEFRKEMMDIYPEISIDAIIRQIKDDEAEYDRTHKKPATLSPTIDKPRWGNK